MKLNAANLVLSFSILTVAACGVRTPLDAVTGDESGSGEGGLSGSGGSAGHGGGQAGTGGLGSTGGRPGTGGLTSVGGRGGNVGGSQTGGRVTTGGAGGVIIIILGGAGGRINSGGAGGFVLGGAGGRINSGGAGGFVVGGAGGRINSGGAGGFVLGDGGSARGGSGGSRGDGGPDGMAGIIGSDVAVRDLLPDRRDTLPTGGMAGSTGIGATGGSVATGGAGGAVGCEGLASNEELIDNLDDGDRFIPRINGRVGSWTDSDDGSPGGAMYPDPANPFTPTDTGDSCRKYAAYVKGTGFSDWGSSFWFGLGSPYDASRYTGISLWARVDGPDQVLRVSFPDKDTDPDGGICLTNVTGPQECYSHYGYRITIPSAWTKFTIPFKSLSQDPWGLQASAFDPSTLYQILFQIPVNATFSIWIDDVAFTM